MIIPAGTADRFILVVLSSITKRLWPVIFAGGCLLFFGLYKIFWLAEGETVRQPRFAGRWYYGNREHLKEELTNFEAQIDSNGLVNKEHIARLYQNEAIIPPGKIIAIISPHAALRYSGLAAAHGYAAVKSNNVPQNIKRIILLGPAHHRNLYGAYLPRAEAFSCPLGAIKIDQDAIQALSRHTIFKCDDDVHNREHSLEMQLPFIAHTFPNTKIVPILIGTGPRNGQAELDTIAGQIKRELKEDDLVIVSSDFTHWGKYYQYLPFQSDVTNNIHKLDSEALETIIRKDCSGFWSFRKRTRDTICGFNAIYVLLAILPADSKIALLDYYTSQEPSGQEELVDNDRSISYVSAVVVGRRW